MIARRGFFARVAAFFGLATITIVTKPEKWFSFRVGLMEPELTDEIAEKCVGRWRHSNASGVDRMSCLGAIKGMVIIGFDRPGCSLGGVVAETIGQVEALGLHVRKVVVGTGPM
jgi:hypothetical protein